MDQIDSSLIDISLLYYTTGGLCGAIIGLAAYIKILVKGKTTREEDITALISEKEKEYNERLISCEREKIELLQSEARDNKELALALANAKTTNKKTEELLKNLSDRCDEIGGIVKSTLSNIQVMQGNMPDELKIKP